MTVETFVIFLLGAAAFIAAAIILWQGHHLSQREGYILRIERENRDLRRDLQVARSRMKR